MGRRRIGTTQAEILAELAVHEELTVADLARLIKRSTDTTHSSLLLLREQNMVYVAKYITTPGRGRESRVWALGNQPDAPRPNFGGAYRKQKRREYSRQHYLKKALRRDGASPWAGLVPIVQRKAA